MSPLTSFRRLLFVVAWLATVLPALAIDYSVPYVRNGLPYAGYSGLGAIVGELEVRDVSDPDGYYNGIDGYDGHRQSLLGPDPGDPYYGIIGFQDVKDFTSIGSAADNNFHGTFVAGIMASEAVLSTGTSEISMMGMAPAARYYGAIFDGAGSKAAFLSLNSSLNYLATVANASVINNSWGSTETSAANLNGSTYVESLLMDEYAGYSGKTGGTTGKYLDKLMVIAAGNSGTSTGLLGAPADSYNGLVVGALSVVSSTASDLLDPSRSPSPTVASYSSWKPLADGRSGVDVVAPGTNLWSTLAINYSETPTNGFIAGTADGTSFAAPHVTGLAAILYGMASGAMVTGDSNTGYGLITYTGLQTEKGTTVSTDHKLIKALIINSATKIPGLDADGNAQTTWQPGKVITTNGVPNAVVALNYAVGAGVANASEAVAEYAEDGNRFWDMGAMRVVGGETYYTLGSGKFVTNSAEQVFLSGLTATLVWDRHVDYTVSTDLDSSSYGEVTKDLLSNLDLILQRQNAAGVWEDVYMSAGDLDNVEHIYYTPVVTGTDFYNNYRLVVRAATLAEPDSDTGETYALVVSYTLSAVPEPAAWALIVSTLLAFAIFHCRARRKTRGAAVSQPPPL